MIDSKLQHHAESQLDRIARVPSATVNIRHFNSVSAGITHGPLIPGSSLGAAPLMRQRRQLRIRQRHICFLLRASDFRLACC